MEKIERAATKTVKGNVYQAKNHSDIMSDMMWNNEYPKKEDVQGFVTSTGRFVDRQEAAEIAFEAGQTNSHTGCLQSFNLTLKNENMELVEA